jgi:hypothetical protein
MSWVLSLRWRFLDAYFAICMMDWRMPFPALELIMTDIWKYLISVISENQESFFILVVNTCKTTAGLGSRQTLSWASDPGSNLPIN